MISIQEVTEKILIGDEEALSAINRGYMSLSRYARRIRGEVEKLTKKKVGVPAIVISLSRLKKTMRKSHPMVEDIEIKNITTRAPLSEIAYEKDTETLNKLPQLYKNIKTTSDDFFTVSVNATDITVMCSERLSPEVLNVLGSKPRMHEKDLAAVGIALDPKYYPMPNITYSLLRRIASKRIPLAETVTAHREITFIFKQIYLPEILALFQISPTS